MIRTFPGTTVEAARLETGASRRLFDGVFAAGGITLSQVCVLSGLEPYVVQNWVKRRFVPPPEGRNYTREHLARVLVIGMLKDSLQIERICGLIRAVGGDERDPHDDLVSFEELYHRYVDLLSLGEVPITDASAVTALASAAASGVATRIPGAQKKLTAVFETMLYAHAAARFGALAEEKLFLLD